MAVRTRAVSPGEEPRAELLAMWRGADDLDDWTRLSLRELGQLFRTFRRQRGLTQQRLADRCGLSQSSISRFENGLAPGLRVVWLGRLLAALQDDFGLPGAWRPLWTPERTQEMRDVFGPRGRMDQRVRQSEADRLDALVDLMNESEEAISPAFPPQA